MSKLQFLEDVEIALSLTSVDSMATLLELQSLTLSRCLQALGCPGNDWSRRIGHLPVMRLHLGNEFCERLLPTPAELERALNGFHRNELVLALATPMLTDAGMSRLAPLLSMMPQGSEIVVNDWGTLHQVRQNHQALKPVLGRLLNKMIKDPRLPSEQWTRLHPHNGQSPHFHRLLSRYGIQHMEMDVPPFARQDQFNTLPMQLSVHLPYGYVVKGRLCRIGSLEQADEQRFVAAHACRKECLSYWSEVEREGCTNEHELEGFQRGNAQFYRHSKAMTQVLWEALEQGRIKRLIVAGDWHENSLAA